MSNLQVLLCVCCGLFASMLGIPVLAGQQAIVPSAVSTTNPPSATSQAPPGNARISLKDGQLSVDFKNLPLERLGDELSHKGGIAVVFMDNAASQQVSAVFQKLPLDQGLHRILRDQDVFYFYSSDGNNASSLKALWIFPKGKARGVAPVPPDQWGSNKDLSALLVSSNPAARGQAAETLIQRKGEAATDVLLRALDDKDAQVRVRALYASMQSGVEVPSSLLTKLTQDSSADVRFLALDALAKGNNPDERSIAEQLAGDSNEAVRNEAREIISRLDAKSGQAAQPQPPASGQQGGAPAPDTPPNP
jgi:hypothetical protein